MEKQINITDRESKIARADRFPKEEKKTVNVYKFRMLREKVITLFYFPYICIYSIEKRILCEK